MRWQTGTPTPTLVGVVHLPPLPGAPTRGPGRDVVLARAEADARALAGAGADGIIVENLGDAPFTATTVEPITVAVMTRAVWAVREAAPDLPIGVNVLRNDALSALGIAAATGAAFVRVNVLAGVMVTDQGIVSGKAHDVAMLRRRLDTDVKVAADVHVKHARPLGGGSLEVAARDTWQRAGADALIVSGSGTGQPTDLDHLRRIRDAVPEAPVWIGSGIDPTSAAASRGLADTVIVGTWLHADGRLDAPIDPARVVALKRALDG